VPGDRNEVAAAWWRRLVLAAAVGALLVVVWALATAWGAVVHGHPAYAVLLGLTVLGAVLVGRRALGPPRARTALRWFTGVLLLALGIAWVTLVAWLRPFTAVEAALSAMEPDSAVEVSETATTIVLQPTGAGSGTAVFFQPGARVDSRAYAAVLRPLAEAGHTVVIAKQPLGIAFLAVGAFDDARTRHPQPERWVVGGHSLGGTVASLEADAADSDAIAPAVGLLLLASYPASDLSTSLTAAVESVSGTEDGLATPDDIEASRADLPPDAQFTVVEGASHAQFGDYGPQPGDGTPTISDDEAREQVSLAAAAFVRGLSG